jgi:hypothetical protein
MRRMGLMRLIGPILPIVPISASGTPSPRRSGAILLEVVMALTLFFITAAVVTGSMNVSLSAARNMKNDATAEDLAVTKLSELQMGVLPVVDAGPNSFADEDPNLDGWTWQVTTRELDEQTIDQGPQLKRVEIAVCHGPTCTVRRLVAILPASDGVADEATPAPGGSGQSANGAGGDAAGGGS